MEIPEAAETAAWRVLYDAKVPMTGREIVFDAVRAAFAAVPDPMALAVEWDKEATSHWSCGDAADDLRAFMRGEK